MRIYMCVILAAFAICGCTSSKEIDVTASLTVSIDSRNVLDTYLAYDEDGFVMRDGARLSVYTFIYDQDGKLWTDKLVSYSDYGKDSLTFNGLPLGEYRIISVSFAEMDGASPYTIKEKESSGSLLISQNACLQTDDSWPCLGVGHQIVKVGEVAHSDIVLSPVCAYVNVSYVNFTSGDDMPDSVNLMFRNNKIMGFSKGAPDYRSSLNEGDYNYVALSVPEDSGHEMCHTFMFMPSEAMEFKVQLLKGEEVKEEFAPEQLVFEAGKAYEFIVDCSEKNMTGDDSISDVEKL